MAGGRRAALLGVAALMLGLGFASVSAALAAPVVGTEATRTTEGRDSSAPADVTANSPLAGGDQTGRALKPLVKGDLRTFDVTGFKLGMSPADVQRAAAAAHLLASDGHRMLPFDPERLGTRGADFKLNVARAAAVRLGRPRPAGPTVVSEVLLYGPTGEKYEINFLPMESGPQLSTVLLIASSKGNTPQSFVNALVEKYGRPPILHVGASDAGARWCTRGFATCEDGPWFGAGIGETETNVKLTGGDRQLIELNRRIEAAGAAAAAASAGRPTF